MDTRPCPSCGKSLPPRSLLCVSCGGFGAVSTNLHLPVSHGASTRACPECGNRMAEVKAGRVELDVCAPCALVWLDDGELVHLPGEVRERLKALRRKLSTAPRGSSVGEDVAVAVGAELASDLLFLLLLPM